MQRYLKQFRSICQIFRFNVVEHINENPGSEIPLSKFLISINGIPIMYAIEYNPIECGEMQ